MEIVKHIVVPRFYYREIPPVCLRFPLGWITVKGRPAQNCHCHSLQRRGRNGHSASIADENDARDHKREKRRRRRRERERGKKVCERLTFPFLLWGLVLVKRFPDILANTSTRSRSPRLTRTRVDLSEGCARHVAARRDISFRLALNEFAWLPNGS